MATSAKEEKEILTTAKERYKLTCDHWNDFYRDSRETLKFIDGEQWNQASENMRNAAGLPVMTINSIPTFLRLITNEARQNQPAIQIDPKDNKATIDTADVLSDMIRGIENDSDADVAYDIGGWYAAATGLGFIRVVSEYEDENSFFQKLAIKAVEDPETVKMDPLHRLPNGSDQEYCFIETLMSKDEYIRSFGDSKLAKDVELIGWVSPESNSNQWIQEKSVLIVEYYWKEYKAATLYQVMDNETGQSYTTRQKPPQPMIDSGAFTILNEREVQDCTIRWAKLNDIEILEETTWPGQYIPVVSVKGEEVWIEGKRKLKGAVKDALDSQRLLNYFISYQAEMVQLAPKAPYVGDPRQFENFEEDWRNANVAPSAYLRANALVINNQVIPPPQRQMGSVDVQAASGLCQQARDNLMAIFGKYQASLGAPGNETSGTAVLTRQTQSHTATYHFYDNLVKAIQQIGVICVDTIPTFYADERSVQLIKRTGESMALTINGNGDTRQKHDMTVGKYGVVVETGASYATRRQDSVSHMIAMGQAYPQALPLIADIIASESDWPGSKEIAARLRFALPPAIQQAMAASSSGVSTAQQAQMAQQQVQQLTQQLQNMTQADQKAQQLLKNADDEIKLLKMKGAVDLQKATMDTSIKEKQLTLDEVTTELEYKVRLKEIALQEAQLELEKQKLGIQSVQVASDIVGDMHDKHIEHIEHMTAITEPEEPKIGTDTGIDKRTLE